MPHDFQPRPATGVQLRRTLASRRSKARRRATRVACEDKPMDDPTAARRRQLIRNVDRLVLEPLRHEPLCDTRYAELTDGTAARKRGAGDDVLAPGMRSCPYHHHLAQEEMFINLEGHCMLPVADHMAQARAGDVVSVPSGPQYPHQFINTSDAPMRPLSISTKGRPEVCV
jgi:uncharacterized cupin superfamily protein